MPDLTPDPGAFDTPIRRAQSEALHQELMSRLRQHGVTAFGDGENDAMLADLLSAIDAFEAAVAHAGGDLFVDSPDSSEPERPEFVLPHPHEDERAHTYLRRVREATERVRRMGDRDLPHPVDGV